MRRNSWSRGADKVAEPRRSPLAKPTSLQVVFALDSHATIFIHNIIFLLNLQDFKRLLAQQTTREVRTSAEQELGVAPTAFQHVTSAHRELAKSGSMKKTGTPWRFSIIQEEPERGRSEEELAVNKNMGPTDL